MFHFTTVNFSILQRAFFRKLEYNPSLRNSPGSNNRKVRLSSCDILQSLTVLSLLNCCIKAESTLFRKELKKSPQNDRAHPFVFPLTFFLPLHKATWSGRMVSPPSASPFRAAWVRKGRQNMSFWHRTQFGVPLIQGI